MIKSIKIQGTNDEITVLESRVKKIKTPYTINVHKTVTGNLEILYDDFIEDLIMKAINKEIDVMDRCKAYMCNYFGRHPYAFYGIGALSSIAQTYAVGILSKDS